MMDRLIAIIVVASGFGVFGGAAMALATNDGTWFILSAVSLVFLMAG